MWTVSRILEIFYAFYNDFHTHLKKPEEGSIPSGIQYFERVHLAMFSYVELIFIFGILYYGLSASFDSMLNKGAINIVDAVYFSGVTITTLGYGDIAPCNPITKFLVIFEVLSGFTLIIVSFTVYVSRAVRELDIN